MEYEKILLQEELIWFQKSCSKWLVYGDKNTKYFHAKSIIKKRKGIIAKLKDNEGNQVEDDIGLQQMSTKSSKKHFSKENFTFSRFLIYNSFPKLEEDALEEIERLVSHEEIKMAMFSMNPVKAPGLDGLHVLFFSKSMGSGRIIGM